ncbi:Ger(x)C family spore germination protein [Clostridium magnum]|uniref:Spore germination protein B3 n=1 Tax=Clostridium magnum DSM 2767 TaxID=1121326 RepID=A0A162RT28_9CLOT|nr:Ger(x)C family spore germination protein [Clostridium magnum]KZL90339.1 spore germination protein B3 precursor [Clostridium magnum DSM 2767]SHH82486.1 spore germination protein [Clostridium magnum DSM 2767]
MKNNILRRLFLLSLISITVFILSGCWGKIEIERRGYILGVAIDKADTKNLNTASFEYMPLETTGPLYAFTIDVPIISSSLNKPSGQSGGNADKARNWTLTVISNTFFEANRQYSTRLNYPPYYSHLQSIVINSDVAEDDISKLLDMFLRDTEMRRRTKVFITPGHAADLLRVIPKIDNSPSQYLKSLPNNNFKTSRLLHKTDLGKVSEAIHEHRDFVLPKVVANKYEIKDAGCAVFKDNKMVGWLDEIRTSYLKWIVNYANGGLVSVNLPECSNSPFTLEIKKIKTKQKPIVTEDSVEMELDIKANLDIGETSLPGLRNVFNSEFCSQLEKAAEKKIKKQIEDTISYVQREYGADVFYFGTNIQRFAPKAWDKLKDNWDEVFKTLRVTVNVEVKINQLGLTR